MVTTLVAFVHRLIEPVYLLHIQAPKQTINGIHSSINQKHGRVLEKVQRAGTFENMCEYKTKARLLVNRSFGLTVSLLIATTAHSGSRTNP